MIISYKLYQVPFRLFQYPTTPICLHRVFIVHYRKVQVVPTTVNIRLYYAVRTISIVSGIFILPGIRFVIIEILRFDCPYIYT